MIDPIYARKSTDQHIADEEDEKMPSPTAPAKPAYLAFAMISLLFGACARAA